MEKELETWKAELLSFSLPKWDDLPDLEIYKDQTITLVQRYVSPLEMTDPHKVVLSASMVNNYVKHGLLPKPIKKKYSSRHLAYLIVITLLKRIFDLQQIKKAIDSYTKKIGERAAYNQFCDNLEQTLQTFLLSSETELSNELISQQDLLKMATVSFVAKLFSEKILSLTPTTENGKDLTTDEQ